MRTARRPCHEASPKRSRRRNDRCTVDDRADHVAQSHRVRQLGEVDVDTVRMLRHPRAEAPEDPGGAGADHRQPQQLDVGVIESETDGLDDRVRPRHGAEVAREVDVQQLHRRPSDTSIHSARRRLVEAGMGSRSRVFIGHLPAGAAVGSSGVLASLGARDEGQRKADCVDDVRRRARRWVDCRRPTGGGVDGRGDLHRLGDPRLPRPAGCVDEEPGRREDRRRCRTTSPIPKSAGRPGGCVLESGVVVGATERRPSGDRRDRARRQAARRRHPEHRRAAPAGRHRSRRS